jgi:PAS domain S-box-containing protein
MNGEATTIVIVDDAVEVRGLLRTRLRLSGLLRVVGEGGNGEDAVALAREHRPSVMLLDVSMPGTDGLEALPRVLDASPRTRVVLYSGFEEQGLVEKARDLGAAAFIEKSTPLDVVVDRLLATAGEAAHVGAHDGRSTSSEPAPAREAHPSSPEQGVLEEHLERFREVFDEAAIGMATMTLTGRLVRANRALANLVRRPVKDLVGVYYGDLTDGRADLVDGALDDIRHRPLEVVQLEHGVSGAGDGQQVRATLAPVRDSAGRPLYLFLQVQDVTAERAATEALRKSEERFRLLVEVVEDYAIFMLDPTGHIVSWNSGAQRTKGYAAQEIVGRHFRVFYPPEVAATGHPERELEIAVREGHYEEEGWRVRKDGTRFWANVLITAVFNEQGEHIGFTKVTRDTTERRRLEQEREKAVEALAEANTELEALNERLRESAEDQTQFLAVTAHELRTPVGVLAGSAETLTRHWADLTEEDRTELSEAIGASASRLRRLLADLLTASRLQRSALEFHIGPVAVSELLEHAVATLGQAHTDTDIHVEVPDGLTVLADRDRIAQVVDNLLGNAVRHGSPPVRVAARRDGADVEIRVSDHGPGIGQEMLPRLFDRFATGRNRGGTGLGLFIVRELARAQGGEATYEPPTGSAPAGSFVVRLPAAPG